MEEEQQQLPRDKWCVESAFSRQGHLKRHKCLLERTVEDREALSSAHCATDGFGGLGVYKRRLYAAKS